MEKFELDHVIPKSRGGTGSRKNNILAVCFNCNRTKNDRGLTYLKKKLKIEYFWFECLGLHKGQIKIPDYSIYGITVNKSVFVDPYAWEKEIK
jgi:hypothetical protein